MQINLFGTVLTGAVRVRPMVAKHIERLQNAPAAASKSVPPGAKSPSPRRHRALAGPRHDHVQAKEAACQRRVNSTCRRHCYAEAVDAGAQTALIWMPSTRDPRGAANRPDRRLRVRKLGPWR